MFRIGDVVTGIVGSFNTHAVTNEYSICTVIDVALGNNFDIRLRVDEQSVHPHSIGAAFWVSSKYFELVKHQIALESQSDEQFDEMLG